jgi:hypothetical protein
MAIGRGVAAGLLGLAVWGAAAPAWAQKPIPETLRMMEPHRLRIGDYVSAWPNEGGPPVSGTIVAVGTSTLTVATKKEGVLLDLSAIHHMNLRQTRSHIRRGTLIGAGVGLLTGLLLVTEEVVGHPIDTSDRIWWTAGLTAGGAALGTGVGYAARSVTWQPVDLVTLKPQAAAAGPAVRVSWTIRF